MTIFNVGDLVRWDKEPTWGQGEILAIINSSLIGVRFEDYDKYEDGNLEDTDYPNLPDFHYVDIKNVKFAQYKYNPDQAGDTDEDI
jgi:hypothetical protein